VAFFGFHFSLESDVEKHLTEWSEEPKTFGHLKMVSERQSLVALMRDVAKWAPDIVLVNAQADLADWISRGSRAPVVFYAHDVAYNMSYLLQAQQRSHWYQRLIGLRSGTFGRTKLVICVSHYVKSIIKKHCPNVNTKVIYDGVDHDRFRPTHEDGQFGLCVSRISGKKNLEILPQAYRKTSYRVVLLGDARKKGLDYAQGLIKGSGIQFEQYVSQEQLIRMMQRCSFFVYPGKDEGMGLAPLEAMACAKPVIAHNSGGTRELVGDAGYLLGDDPSEWTRASDQLMSSRTLRTEVGQKALERSLQFSWEKTASELEVALLESLS